MSIYYDKFYFDIFSWVTERTQICAAIDPVTPASNCDGDSGGIIILRGAFQNECRMACFSAQNQPGDFFQREQLYSINLHWFMQRKHPKMFSGAQVFTLKDRIFLHPI